jgi:translocation and assembly module TamA
MSQVVAGRRTAGFSLAIALILAATPALAQAGSQNGVTNPPSPRPAPDRRQTDLDPGNVDPNAPLEPLEPLDPGTTPGDAGQLDPSAPLDPWPSLGIEWPDMAPQADEIPSTANPAAVADTSAARHYSWRVAGLDGIESEGLLDQFRSLSTLQEYHGDPANSAQIDRRARADADLLQEILRSHGYYDALVTTDVTATQTSEFSVVLTAQPGAVYHFSEVRLPGLESANAPDVGPLRQAFAVDARQVVDAARVEQGEAALKAELGRRGYAFAQVGEPDVLIDHETQSAVLTLSVQPMGVRRFGTIHVEGNPPFSARHVQTIARFEPGEQWRTDRIEDLRQALIQTSLVSTVNITPVARPDSDVVDLDVALEPAPRHTIAGEAGYNTGEGVRLEASWQDRNLIRPEGAVTLRGVLGTREQLLSAILRQSNWHERDQTLNAQIAASHSNLPAFNARTFTLTGGIERQSNLIWQKAWTWSVGGELIASDERDVDVASGTIRNRTFFIAAVPGYLGYDGSNSLLDPTTGFRLSLHLSPEASLQSGTFFYARAQVDASFYQPVSDRITIAGRTRLGTILGAQRDQIAPSRRFYAGGGGSVRGYGYQAIGPRDPVFNDPIGGRSLAEFSIEARIRFGNFGVVPFVDAGNISTASLPRFNDLQFGTGLGVRYYSSFGPIRLDIGTPLNRRPGDPRIAVYVSLGQAF